MKTIHYHGVLINQIQISLVWYVGVGTFLHKILPKELVFERFRIQRNFSENLKQFHKVFTKLEPIVEKMPFLLGPTPKLGPYTGRPYKNLCVTG